MLARKMRTTSAVTVVTVTYGKRWHLLQRVLQEVRAQGVREVVLVDNAADLPTAELAAEFGDFVKIVHLSHNSGSAAGFKRGIIHALEAGAEYLLMLDDDNVPLPGSIALLSQSLAEVRSRSDSKLVAVLGNRYNPDSMHQFAGKSTCMRQGSFLGFHLFEVPAKIFKRLCLWAQIPAKRVIPPLFTVNVCTYGGLMFHRSLIERVGLPYEDFVLYVDDYELTYRITSSGGSITLVTAARIDDLEIQWNSGERFSSTFKAWLLGEGDLRAYYTARNLCYFETNLQHHCKWLRQLNKVLYFRMLQLFAWRLGRAERLALLRKAVHDGESGVMGVCPEYPL
jgi:GT2 family glycosyltransferase